MSEHAMSEHAMSEQPMSEHAMSEPATPQLPTLALYRSLRRFLREDRAATAIEYALIASGISIVIAATVVAIGGNVQGMFSNVATALK
jgi:pilus assembly protein Flp/PilA